MQYVRSLRVTALSILCGAAIVLAGCDSGGVNNGNQAPTADIAVSSATIAVGTQVVLDGSGSSDPDGSTLNYNWSLDTPSGSQASLSDASAAQPTFTPDVAGDYTATLEVSDGSATNTTSTTITATAQSSTVELNGTITSDSTLTAAQDYIVTGGFSVEDGATLTIDPGTDLAFESGTGLYVGNNSVLDADGTSSEPITMTATEGNEQSGWWDGVFVFSDEPNNLLNHVEIRHTGNDSPNTIDEEAGVALSGGASLSMSNSTIAESEANGLYLNEADAVLDDFSTNTFSDNAGAPVNIPFTNIGAIDAGSTFPDDKTVRIWGTTLEGGRTVTVNALSGDTPYRIAGNSAIGDPTGGSSTVTIEPGVEMTFASNVRLIVNGGSVLSADGTSAEPITMRATEGNAQPGWWEGVYVFSGNANNVLNHVEVRHAGGGSPNSIRQNAGIGVAGGASLTLTNSTVAESESFGVYLDEATAVLENFSSNTFSGNADAPVNIPFSNVGVIDGNSTFPADKTVRVWGTALAVNGATNVTMTALNGDTPYRFASTPSVGGDASLTIEPGVEMTFEADVGLRISNNSSLTADGTSTEPITMTATAGNAQQGWWRGIAFYSDNANNLLNHVEVRHAGRTSMSPIPEAANVGLSVRSSLEVTNSTITDSGNHGIYCDPPSSGTVSGNTYQNNAGQNTKDCS